MAELLNEQVGNYEYDYMDFYMGSSWVAGRADLSPIYRMIFRRMKAIGLDWVYHFPRLLLVDFRPLKAAMDEAAADAEQQPDWEGYDPASALEKAEDDRRRDEEISEMRASLDEAHREAVEEAQQMPPPAIVQAYQEIYGMLPEGWPPSV